ncbi:tubulin-specific chaperone E [Achlya hypogyna]|uniref:Tubulin-specific chaperone E n=1 Tax=Achlya hypogyna TaxID=1202772 RepID=A0A1V9ZHI1_ACHHY|nr:tubulin-specific chaperone E [Achlya hypogyna]
MATIGDRVEDADGFRGTVRYVGSIQSKGDQVYWGTSVPPRCGGDCQRLGIEWDDSSRGKHGGAANGVQYFVTRAPTAGTFVAPEKVSRGRGLLPALHERYMQAEASDVRVAGEVATAGGSSKSIQLVGVHKIQEKQHIGVICKVSLEGCQVATLPTPAELAAVAPNIQELDLGFNLLASWAEVLSLATALPKLEQLVLSGNRLQYDATADAGAFPLVTRLVLNQTATSWTDLLRICVHFPALRELHVAANDLADADLIEGVWPETLELVDVSHNSIGDWAAVQRALGGLPALRHLVATHNALGAIAPSAAGSFASLESLALGDNRIASWASMDALNSFPALTLLRFAKNPLVAGLGAGEARMMVVARCGRLLAFNGSEIRAKERTDAEQMYLKRIIHEVASFKDDADKHKVLASHPRYIDLLAKYPDIQKPATTTGGPAALARSLVAVTFVPMSSQAATMEPMAKKLPLNMTVGQLKTLVGKKYGLEPAALQLSFRATAKEMPVPLDDDSGDVGYYGLQDGAEILVNDVW